ncbi:sodium/glutamate symporter [Acinetobacter proteolyticus]|jgi:ESS family glutamate:Na+ symporter|uniref:Sodium/glutamate symporter n=1 Tax=Acinetobacter proteolyticus TaxID=1776741 RepID=A0A653K014_9GAMM|nr:sodium/glutamate symporter [Acinetobacter proteolyticus]OEY94886.1 sodium/glutamate symporter [Acinetobacter proteolyticus]PKF34709.1 sodium/glutamate symporter [Acinetobacter proteolyticus]WEI18226.1 sodium/glutamate symporter [Acinetobacter proteolyticus]VXA53977.1 Sodium/glutamate symporter [Acinetobacter proteolyticus]
MDFILNPTYTLMLAVLVLYVGRILNKHIPFLTKYNIPEPVAGGLVGAIIFYLIHQFAGYTISVNKPMQDTFMLMFFASIGLSANFAKLKEGGKPLIIFLIAISFFVIIQNGVGMAIASAVGLDPLMGVVAGSIALVGGLGTAGAWGPIFETKYAVEGALPMGIASATFGMVVGGLMGGPLARYLIRKHNLASPLKAEVREENKEAPLTDSEYTFEAPQKVRLITADNAIVTLGMFAFALAFAETMKNLTIGTAIELPTFVWALGGGILLRNILETGLKQEIFDRSIDVFGNTALALFLAMALVSLKLWQLADLAIPMIILLIAQSIAMWVFAVYVSFRVMGKNYDSAVLASGLCGFGMGATPNAIANMQAITNMYGPSHKAFLIVPLVGAFFIDLVNVVVIQSILQIFG